MLIPRLKTSKKWTAFPAEFTEQIRDVFQQAFSAQLVGHDLIVEGQIYPQEILLRVGILADGEIRQHNFEISVDYGQKKGRDAQTCIHDAVDAAASMMAEYFEKAETEDGAQFPRIWDEIDFKGNKIYIQSSSENTNLEAQANALLGLSDDDLVKELEDAEAELEELAENPTPTIFSGKNKKH